MKRIYRYAYILEGNNNQNPFLALPIQQPDGTRDQVLNQKVVQSDQFGESKSRLGTRTAATTGTATNTGTESYIATRKR